MRVSKATIPESKKRTMALNFVIIEPRGIKIPPRRLNL